MLKRIDHLFASAYLLLLFCVYPFYVQDGYVDIGEAKSRFFICVSIAAFFLLALCAAVHFAAFVRNRKGERRPYFIEWEQISLTDLCVMLYGVAVFWSYILTDYREEALWGTQGWYMGAVPLLLLCGLYFMISRMWQGGELIMHGCMAASGAVFVLGVLNRFSFYPIRFEILQPDFVSTLGNINWYCGYLSVIAPVGVCLFLFPKSRAQGKGQALPVRLFYGLYVLICFTAGFCQGSSSVFLWFGALFLILLFLAADNRERILDWTVLVFLWGVCAQLVRLLRLLLPGRYNYDTDNLCGYFTDSPLTLWICLGAGLLYGWVRMEKKEKDWEKRAGKIRKWLALSVCLLACLWLVLSAANTLWGIPSLRDKGMFSLNADWGNGRGCAIYAGAVIWKEMPLVHKLVGAGPDCFSKYAYSLPETERLLRECFGASRLCNAHCELLTGLVNTGVFGLVFYIGIFASFIRDCIKMGRKNTEVILFGVCAFCYLIHNMVSFAQVLNLPFAFLLMGMGTAVMRKIRRGMLTSP